MGHLLHMMLALLSMLQRELSKSIAEAPSHCQTTPTRSRIGLQNCIHSKTRPTVSTDLLLGTLHSEHSALPQDNFLYK